MSYLPSVALIGLARGHILKGLQKKKKVYYAEVQDFASN